MAKNAVATHTFEITEEQRNLVLNGLVEKLLDTRRYLSDSEEKDEPGPLDSCCKGHLQRYESRRVRYRALVERKEAIEAAIELFSVDDVTSEPTGSSS